MPAAPRSVDRKADKIDEAVVRAFTPKIRYEALDLLLIHYHRLPLAQEKLTFTEDEIAD